MLYYRLWNIISLPMLAEPKSARIPADQTTPEIINRISTQERPRPPGALDFEYPFRLAGIRNRPHGFSGCGWTK
jgi:hypothetical protein